MSPWLLGIITAALGLKQAEGKKYPTIEARNVERIVLSSRLTCDVIIIKLYLAIFTHYNLIKKPFRTRYFIRAATIVTRVGDFLQFGQLFKAFCNNAFAQISY